MLDHTFSIFQRMIFRLNPEQLLMERGSGWETMLAHGDKLIQELSIIDRDWSTEVIMNNEVQLGFTFYLSLGIEADQITQQWCVQNPELCLLSESDTGTEEEKCDIDTGNGAEAVHLSNIIVFTLTTVSALVFSQ